MKPQYALCALCLIMLSSVTSTVFADSDVRDFEGLAYVPNNTVAMFGYFRHTSSADTKVMGGNFTSQELGGIRATYILHYGGLAIVPFDASIFALDYTLYEPGGSPLHGSGFTDPEYFPTIAYVVPEGSPSSQTHTVFAFNPRVTIPVGTYDTNNLINAGQHRVTFKPQISIAQRFAKVFTAEIVGNIAIHSTNSKFVFPIPMMNALATTSMTQDSDLFIDAHLGADLSKTFFLGASYYYSKIGQQKLTELPGEPVATKSGSVSSLRFSLGIRVEKNTLLLLQVDQNFAASGSAAIDRFAGIRISHVFFDEPEPSVAAPRREPPEPPPVQNPSPNSPPSPEFPDAHDGHDAHDAHDANDAADAPM
jgi:Putative MetA-pathway of phenol degradation